jgi:tRNA 2-selenouridine synthase
VVEIEVNKDVRIERLVNEYGVADEKEFLEAMSRIVKKLGGQHYNAAREKYLSGDLRSTIDLLLTYYDKAYRTALVKKKDRIKHHTFWNGENVNIFAKQLVAEVNSAVVMV